MIRGSRVYDLDDETGVELQHAFEAGGDTSLTQAAATLLGDAPELSVSERMLFVPLFHSGHCL